MKLIQATLITFASALLLGCGDSEKIRAEEAARVADEAQLKAHEQADDLERALERDQDLYKADKSKVRWGAKKEKPDGKEEE